MTNRSHSEKAFTWARRREWISVVTAVGGSLMLIYMHFDAGTSDAPLWFRSLASFFPMIALVFGVMGAVLNRYIAQERLADMRERDDRVERFSRYHRRHRSRQYRRHRSRQHR